MTNETNIEKPAVVKLAEASSIIRTYNGFTNWEPEDVDKLDVYDLDKFIDIVNDCRFFYERDPIAATVINKLVDIGISDIEIDKGQLSENEYRIFVGLKDKLLSFMESCALEYLLSGFVVPEIKYNPSNRETLQKMGVKKYNTIIIPTDMWLRDPTTIKINSTMVLDKPSYFIKVSEELYYFIMHEGEYADGTKDPELWLYLQSNYPEFIYYVKAGNKLIPYYNELILRRKITTKSPYPIPYLYPALEALKHKRNLRRMDYSIASRVISAIQLVKLGDKDFPLLEEDDDAFASIKNQMAWRNSQYKDIERIFQLFANHTLTIEWVYPPVEALMNDKKYAEVNQDIFFALGFPKILITGESERSNSSDPEMAMISPVKTMEKMQRDLLSILKDIIYKITTLNDFKSAPDVRFSKISLYSIEQLITILTTLYNTGNLSRETFDKAFGYSFSEEVEKRSKEEKKMVELQVPGFSPQPFSPPPTTQQDNPDNKESKKEDTKTKDNSKSKNIDKNE